MAEADALPSRKSRTVDSTLDFVLPLLPGIQSEYQRLSAAMSDYFE
jgi:hypothetical protein